MKNITTIKPEFWLNEKRIHSMNELLFIFQEFNKIETNDKKEKSDLFQSFLDFSVQTFLWNEDCFNIFKNPVEEFNYWTEYKQLDKLTPALASSFLDDIFRGRCDNYDR
ncbi:hypothetical protein [Staphylococcus saprophyticus]|uniref:hypothetical protein n=1 Tax=Staphylococcus saprophyticus TaxID=29385 RepID=UPI002DBABF1F|nr:hypothetical protein [Staphylococcus saprophyticus]MEB8114962.1 hypothetical protein [Staphylococcus saprophyticus]